MKKILSFILVFAMIFLTLSTFTSCDLLANFGSGNGRPGIECTEEHIDLNEDDNCDNCGEYLVVVIDFYNVNDIHGKFCDSDKQPGVDELATYLKRMQEIDDNTVFLSTGDMWQGSGESNLTRGSIFVDWMNELGFVSMTLGNHEFDWGQDAIRDNLEISEFPFLAINVYNRETDELADYCTPSVMIERDGVQIGIIGAIGDCYSSISFDRVSDVYFKVGAELTSLVKAESERLRAAGADIIVYSLHDGHDQNKSGTGTITNNSLQGYYSPALSAGYVDIVFEGHTHKSYTLSDAYGVYHLQGGGENSAITHAELAVNPVTGKVRTNQTGLVSSSVYDSMEDDIATENIEKKYSEIIEMAYSPIGTASKYYDDEVLEAYLADLYLEVGINKWGSQYDIVLGGGFIRTRSPYNLQRGEVTYSDLLSLFPFDNHIVLCSISGSKLKSQFINSTSSDYYNSYSFYGDSILNNILDNETYYIVVDTYTAFYSYNGITIIEYYDDTTFARDLIAEAIKRGGL